MPIYGFAPYNPSDETRALVRDVHSVLDEYEAYLPLTIRQVFYRLVGSRGYDKTEAAYKRLVGILGRARRARLIPMSHIRDDGVQVERPMGYASAAHALTTLVGHVREYRRDRQMWQPVRIMAACEAAGMVPQLVRVCDPLGIEVRSSGGFDSITAKHDLSQDVVRDGRDTVLLHIGDHDPSGYHLYKNLEADVRSFIEDMAMADIGFSVDRVAITPDQVVEYGFETAPKKATDDRSFPGIGRDRNATAQAEAIPPDQLATILSARIDKYINRRALKRVMAHEEAERERLERAVTRLRVQPRGRPAAFDDEKAELARDLRAAGASLRDIAKELRVSKSAVHRLIAND